MKNTYKYLTQQHTILHNFIFYDSSADDETCEESGGKHFDKFNPYIDVSLPQFKLLNEEWAKAA